MPGLRTVVIGHARVSWLNARDPLGLLAWYHVGLTSQAWNLIPIVALLAAWTLAVALFLAALQVRFRDVGVALPALVQLWMFASPVIYPLGVVPAGWRTWYLLN